MIKVELKESRQVGGCSLCSGEEYTSERIVNNVMMTAFGFSFRVCKDHAPAFVDELVHLAATVTKNSKEIPE